MEGAGTETWGERSATAGDTVGETGLEAREEFAVEDPQEVSEAMGAAEAEGQAEEDTEGDVATARMVEETPGEDVWAAVAGDGEVVDWVEVAPGVVVQGVAEQGVVVQVEAAMVRVEAAMGSETEGVVGRVVCTEAEATVVDAQEVASAAAGVAEGAIVAEGDREGQGTVGEHQATEGAMTVEESTVEGSTEEASAATEAAVREEEAREAGAMGTGRAEAAVEAVERVVGAQVVEKVVVEA